MLSPKIKNELGIKLRDEYIPANIVQTQPSVSTSTTTSLSQLNRFKTSNYIKPLINNFKDLKEANTINSNNTIKTYNNDNSSNNEIIKQNSVFRTSTSRKTFINTLSNSNHKSEVALTETNIGSNISSNINSNRKNGK